MGFIDNIRATADAIRQGTYTPSTSYGGQSQYTPTQQSTNWQDFMNLRQQIADRNAYQGIQGVDYFGGYNGDQNTWRNYVNQRNQQQQEQENNRSEKFSLSGGTEPLYNGKYRRANAFDTLAVEAAKTGEWWMNLPSNLASMAGNEQLAQDLKFDASKFDLSRGLDSQNMQQLGNFALSVPGMIPGGLFEGAGKAYEAATGAPIQEYKEAKGGGYEIPDYELDLNQRFASGADAAIDLFGTFTGGSGKAISVAGKAVGRGLEKRAVSQAMKELGSAATSEAKQAAAQGLMTGVAKADRFTDRANKIGSMTANAGRGLIDRAVDKAGLGAGAQFAANVVEEAGEEFAQSYLEDFRNKEYDPNGSFDKAVQSAAWGALGGGLMHGMGAIGNKVLHGRYDANHKNDPTVDGADPQSAVSEAFSRSREYERFAQRNQGFAGSTTTAAIRKAADEKIKNPDKIPASSSAFGTQFANDLTIRQMRASLDMLDGMYQMDDNGQTLAGLAQRFSTTPEYIENIYEKYGDNRALRLAAWKNLLESAVAKNGRVTILGGRNPDTNKIGVADFDVVDIVDGGGLQLHPQAYKMLGGDVDGDRYQSYFYATGPARSMGYLTDNLVNLSTKKSNMDEDYLTFLGDKKAERGFKNSLEAINETMLGGALSDHQIKNLRTQFRESNMSSDNALDKVSNFFKGMFKSEIRKALGDDVQNKEQIVGEALAQVMMDTHLHVTRTASEYEEVLNKLTTKSKDEMDELTKLVTQDSKFLRSGDNKGKIHAADFLALFGKRIGLNVGADLGGNAVMRQTGALKFEAGEDQGIWFDDSLSSSEVQDRFANLIAYSFALENIGADVENSIESVFMLSVMDSTMARFVAGNERIDISSNWNTFSQILFEEYNARVKDFNAVLTSNSTDYGMDVVLGAKKQELKQGSMADLAQAFHRIFGNTKIEELVAIDDKSPLYGMTFDQVITEFAMGTQKDFGPFSNIPGFNKFFKYLVNDYHSTFNALQSRYEGGVSDIGNKLVSYGITDVDQLIRVNRDNDGKIIGVDIIAQDPDTVKYAVEAAQYIFGEDECMAFGLGTIEGFLTTQWGVEWMSGDMNRMLNAVLSIKLNYLYINAVNLAVKQPANWENDFQLELERLAQDGGFVEKMILADWEEHHDMGLLKILQDLDTTYLDKNAIWNQCTKEIEGVGNLLSEFFATGNSEFGTSIYTRKLKNAKRSMVNASQRSTKINRETLERIKDSPFDSKQKLQALQHFMDDAYVTASTNAVAAFVHSQRDVIKGMVEKGVAPETSDIVFQIREHILKGGLFSALEEIDLGCGSMTIGKFQTNRVQLIKCFQDPEIQIRAYDPTRDKYIWISRDAIFDEVLGADAYNPDTQWEAWEALFDACPQLVSLITPTHIGVQTTERNPSVNEGVRLTLDKAIEKYVNGTKNVTGEFEHIQHRNQAFHIAMSNPNWWAVLVADPRIAESASLAETKNVVEDALRENLEWILTVASLDPDTTTYYEKCSMLGKQATRQMFSHAQDMVRDATLESYLTSTLGSTSSEMTSRMFNTSVQMIMDSAVGRILGKQGLYIDANGDLKPIESQRMQDAFDVFSSMPMEMSEAAGQFAQNMSQAFSDTMNLGANHIKLMYALMNMIDPNMFRYNDYVRTIGVLQNLDSALEKYEASHQGDPEAQRKIAEINTALTQFDEGGIGGFTNFVFGFDVMQMLATGQDIDVISTSEVATMSQDDFIAAVDHICERYNFNEDKKKRDKDIKKAFEITDDAARIERLNNIKNYYNQIIVTYCLQEELPAGGTYNLLAPKQTMEAYKTMFDVADEVRRKIGSNLEPSTRQIGQLRLGYGNPVTSCMSQHMAMNAASGSITTGIGLDGSMLNLVGGLGLIDKMQEIEVNASDISDFYIGWTYRAGDQTGVIKTPNDVARINSLDGTVFLQKDGFIGDSVDTLINFIQEPLHLREKKSLGAIQAFADPTQIDKQMYSDLTVAEIFNDKANKSLYEGLAVGDLSLREALVGALRIRRSKVEQHMQSWFDSDEASELHFDTPHAKMFANIMVNLIEVRVNDDPANGVKGGVYCISSSALANDETFEARQYDFGYGPGVMPPMDNIVIRPVVMGLQEVSEKIIRNVANHYYASEDEGNHPSESEVIEWANQGMDDFDGYNDDPISMDEFLRGIRANPKMVDNPMLGDMNYSARMLWDEKRSNVLSATFGSKPISVVPMTDTDRKSVV